jgi:hypothetical protein
VLKMSGFDALFATAGNFYLLLALATVCVALWMGKTWPRKFVYATLALISFVAPIAPEIYRTVEYRGKVAKSQELFEERCKLAGEKIYKTVEDVGAILLVNSRPRRDHGKDQADSNWIGAGFATESTGNQFIAEFLYFNHPAVGLHARELTPVEGGTRGYAYVHVVEEDRHVRYSLRAPKTFVSTADPIESYGTRQATDEALPPYVVEYENIDDPVGRKNWVAGARVRVLDRLRNELLGEFVHYSFEPGLGSSAGFRQPWNFAIQCPRTTYGGATGHIRSFVERILKPAGN